MKKFVLMLILLLTAGVYVKAQDCGNFTSATVCSQSPPGQQTNCCRCVGTQPQNASFCAGTPINKGLIVLIIGGLAIGTYLLKDKFVGGQRV